MSYNVVEPYIMFALCLCLVVVLYMNCHGPKWWGPERGVPFCGHPFETAVFEDHFGCPKCGVVFINENGQWVPLRKDGRLVRLNPPR